MSVLFLSVCVILLTVNSAEAQLPVNNVQCGQKICKNFEYCAQLDNTCQPCSSICEKSHHNFEPVVCERQCQDYIHDQRFVKKSNDGSNQDDLRRTVENLTTLVTICLVLICFILIILAAVFALQMYRWVKKKNITLGTFKSAIFSKNSHQNDTKTYSTNQEEKPRSLKLDIQPSETHSDHSPVTVTTSISRRPAEDNALDYAYDNPAMTETQNRRF